MRSLAKKPADSGNAKLLTVRDFLKYLEVEKPFPKPPNAFRVARIVEQMVSAGLLMRTARGDSGIAALRDHYVSMVTVEGAPRHLFQLVPVLGPEYLHRLCAPSLVHITGKNDGDPVAGTGLVVDASHILTCRHVVSDIKLDRRQGFQGRQYGISAIHRHREIDVAVLRVEGPPLSPARGLLLQAPVVAQTVYTLGYPKLPGFRDASVTMQEGAVTNESVTSLTGERLFLYSAISRPGNSGGPVISADGYVVGLSIVDSTGEYLEADAFSPHYAGIPAQVLATAVKDLGLGVQLPLESYE